MTFLESDLQFNFAATQWQIMKYDSHQYFKTLSGAGLKGVDFIGIYQQNQLVFFEVKNFRAYAAEVNTTFSIFENTALFIENIQYKLEDTLTAINVIIKYLNRKSWYRYFLKLESYIPARFFQNQDWYFWHQIHRLWKRDAVKTFVLWLEIDKKHAPKESANFKEALADELRKAIENHHFKVIISNKKNPVFIDSLNVKKGT